MYHITIMSAATSLWSPGRGRPFAPSRGAMRCPECHTHNDDDSAACATCGLILLAPPVQQTPEHSRRAADLARNRRRMSDRSMILCRFCGGEIYSDGARARHCSEIINDDYFRQRAQKLRGRLNYASWVAYIFGLGALL